MVGGRIIWSMGCLSPSFLPSLPSIPFHPQIFRIVGGVSSRLTLDSMDEGSLLPPPPPSLFFLFLFLFSFFWGGGGAEGETCIS